MKRASGIYEGLVKIWLEKGKRFYIWGGGENGKAFYKKYVNKIHIDGIIDSNKTQWSKAELEGFGEKVPTIFGADAIPELAEHQIIVAVDLAGEIFIKLQQENLVENVNYCSRHLFMALFELYNNEKLYTPLSALIVTNKCTLRCKNCSMAVPYQKDYREIDLEQLKKNVDAYFRLVDIVHSFNLLGGEVFTYSQLIPLMRYIGERYREKMEEWLIPTNGTCALTNETLELLKKYNITLLLDDYSEAVPSITEKTALFKKTLDKFNIKYQEKKLTLWLDLGYNFPDVVPCDEIQAIKRFELCRHLCRGIYQNKIYYCSEMIGIMGTGRFEPKNDDCVELAEIDKKSFLEWDNGYVSDGHVSFCHICNGWDFTGGEQIFFPAGEQV